MKPLRLFIAQKICKRLPPIISQQLRTFIYPYKMAINDNYQHNYRSITGSNLTCTTKDLHGYSFGVHGFFEWRNIAISSALTKKGDIIVEVGANVGTETVGFSDIIGQEGKVYAFEPLPSNLKVLEQLVTLSKNKNISIEPIALSDKTAKLLFSIPPERMSGSGHLVQNSENKTDAVVEVTCTKLDTYIDKIKKCKIIYIDTEGEEIRVLRGGQIFFEKHRPFIVIEASPKNLQRSGFTVKELYDELTIMNYQMYVIGKYGLTKVKDTEDCNECNWFCLPQNDPAVVKKIAKWIKLCLILPCIPGINPMAR